jgi:hypothetical protein
MWVVYRVVLVCYAVFLCASLEAFADDEDLLSFFRRPEDAVTARPRLDIRQPESAVSSPVQVFFSDKGRVFSPLLADPREAQFHLGFMRETKTDAMLMDMSFGGDLGFLRYDVSASENLSITIRGLMTARFEFLSESFDLLNVDFVGGPAWGYRYGNNSFELFFYHQSSHLGDETLECGERQRIDYSREALRVLWSHHFDLLRLYGGPTINFRSDPNSLQGRLSLQLGAERTFLVWGERLYGAVDLQSKQENDWYVNLSVQFGLDIGAPEETVNRQRLFLEFFQGFSNMGQFHNEREFYIMFGIAYNFG